MTISFMNHFENTDVDDMVILEWLLRKQGENIWTGLSGSGAVIAQSV
jgi:hypothetical protein